MALYDMYTEGGGDDDAAYEKPNTPSRIPLLKSRFVQYIKSPLYKKRLEMQGVKNPDKVVKERVEKLNSIETSVGPSSSLSYIFTKPNQKERVPALTVKQKDSDYTAMHEISHVTNYGDVFFDPTINKSAAVGNTKKFGDMDSASGKGMSVNEMLYIADRSNMLPKYKNYLHAVAESNKKSGSFLNPAESITGVDTHGLDPSELKSDLDAVRLLFNDYGITKSFGADIDEATIEKALKNPKIANEPHFQRMLKQFSKKKIVEINNSVAKNNGLAGSTMA